MVDGVGQDFLVGPDVEHAEGEVVARAGQLVLVQDHFARRGAGHCQARGRRRPERGCRRRLRRLRAGRPWPRPAPRSPRGPGSGRPAGSARGTACRPATRDQYHQPWWKTGVEMSVSATRTRICSKRLFLRRLRGAPGRRRRRCFRPRGRRSPRGRLGWRAIASRPAGCRRGRRGRRDGAVQPAVRGSRGAGMALAVTVARRSYPVGSRRARVTADAGEAARAGGERPAGRPGRRGRPSAGGRRSRPLRTRSGHERLLAVVVGDPDDPAVMLAAEEMAGELWQWARGEGGPVGSSQRMRCRRLRRRRPARPSG